MLEHVPRGVAFELAVARGVEEHDGGHHLGQAQGRSRSSLPRLKQSLFPGRFGERTVAADVAEKGLAVQRESLLSC